MIGCNNDVLISSGFVSCKEQRSGCSCNGNALQYYKYTNPTNKLEVQLYPSGQFSINQNGRPLQFGQITETDDSQLIDRLGKV